MLKKSASFYMNVVLILSVATAWVLKAPAQVTTASMSGVVQDETGAIVPNATIKVTQTSTGFSASAISNDAGLFSLNALPVGPYTLSVDMTGFAPYQASGIVLTVGQDANLHVQLKPAGATETVTVSASAIGVETTENTIQNTVDQTGVSELPLKGRDPADLIQTVAGVANAVQNLDSASQNANTNQIKPADSSLPSAVAPTIHGVRAGGVYFSLDGAGNTDPFTILGGPFPNPDATQEFSVVTGTYGARYVSAPGGAVNIVSRSGTNRIHGTLFEFLRNGYTNATSHEGIPDNMKRNQFGGALGAPLIKNKLFIFGAFQADKISQQLPSNMQVPTASERQGIFPSFTIPSFMLSPQIQKLMVLIPEPGSDGEVHVGVPNDTSEPQLTLKTDYEMGQHQLFARYLYDHYTRNANRFDPSDILTMTGGEHFNWDSVAAGDTWVFGKWISNTRASYLDIKVTDTPSDPSVNFTTLGITGITQGVDPGIPYFIGVGTSFTVDSQPLTETPRTSLEFSQDMIYARGNHQVSFGADYRHITFRENNRAGQNPPMIFTGTYSGIVFGTADPFADMMAGHPTVFEQLDGLFASANGNLFGLYAEDKYRATSRLTLTGGLRWDPYFPYTTNGNHLTCFIPGEQSQVFINAPEGMTFPGDPGCSSSGISRRLDFWQPRVGFGYQVDKAATTAIRGGFGLYQMQVPERSYFGFSVAPWVREYVIANPFQNIDDIWPSGSNPFATGWRSPNYTAPANYVFPSGQNNAAAYAHNFNPGYIEQWTLSVQRSLTPADLLEVAYVGTVGRHESLTEDENQAVYVPGNSIPNNTANRNARRPYQSVAQVTEVVSNGMSSYNGLEATYHHSDKHGLNLMSTFAWSKCIDTGSVYGDTYTVTAVKGGLDVTRGRCDFDQDLVFTSTFTWNSPALHGSNQWTRGVLGSWIASGTVIADAGQPFSVPDSADDSSTTGLGLEKADLTGQPTHVSGRLNLAAFQPAALGTWGDSGRNSYRGPNYVDVDFGLGKDFKLPEKMALTFRAEAFDLFNHPNGYNIITTISGSSSSQFGLPNNYQDPRIMQFSLKLAF